MSSDIDLSIALACGAFTASSATAASSSAAFTPRSGSLPATYSICASIRTSAALSHGLGSSGAPAMASKLCG